MKPPIPDKLRSIGIASTHITDGELESFSDVRLSEKPFDGTLSTAMTEALRHNRSGWYRGPVERRRVTLSKYHPTKTTSKSEFLYIDELLVRSSKDRKKRLDVIFAMREEGLTYREIAEACGLSEGTIYEYFRTKRLLKRRR